MCPVFVVSFFFFYSASKRSLGTVPAFSCCLSRSAFLWSPPVRNLRHGSDAQPCAKIRAKRFAPFFGWPDSYNPHSHGFLPHVRPFFFFLTHPSPLIVARAHFPTRASDHPPLHGRRAAKGQTRQKSRTGTKRANVFWKRRGSASVKLLLLRLLPAPSVFVWYYNINLWMTLGASSVRMRLRDVTYLGVARVRSRWSTDCPRSDIQSPPSPFSCLSWSRSRLPRARCQSNKQGPARTKTSFRTDQ